MRIGANLSGVDLNVLNNLSQALSDLALSSARLSTMQRVNRGRDDPAGLLSVEQIESELASLEAASRNASRAVGVIHTADAAMGQVSSLLRDVRGATLEVAGGGLSDAEIDAKQIEIDAALEAIDHISHSTSLGGRKLLDGSGTMTFCFSADVGDTATLDLPSVGTSALGGPAGLLNDLASGGPADMKSGNLETAAEILDAAESEVLHARAAAGSFEKYTIESSQNLLDTMQVNLSEAASMIRDTDVAAETSNLIRSQILADASFSTLLVTAQRRGAIGALLG